MSSKTDIFNLALSYLGAQRISSPTDNSKNAITILTVYDMIRQAELRKKPAWNFATKMAQLPASSITPLFDRANAFPLPADFLAMADPYPESNYNDKDWVIQDGAIYTNYDAPLNIKYVADVTDTTKMDPIFIQAFAAMLAFTVSDQITQSNSKMQSALAKYGAFILDARRADSFDNVAQQAPLDTYWTARL